MNTHKKTPEKDTFSRCERAGGLYAHTHRPLCEQLNLASEYVCVAVVVALFSSTFLFFIFVFISPFKLSFLCLVSNSEQAKSIVRLPSGCLPSGLLFNM